MRTASRQRSPGRLVAFFSGLAALIFARACLIEIEKPLETAPNGGVGGSVSTGGSAGTGAAGNGASGATGGSSGAAGSDASDAPSCGAGMKGCEGTCVRVTDAAFGCTPQGCNPCFGGNADATCSDAGACVFDRCKAGHVDCNNSTEDGCEVRFGPEPSELASFELQTDGGLRLVHRVPALPAPPVINGDPSDWPRDFPLVRLGKPCADCQRNPVGDPGGEAGVPVRFPEELPLETDLDAYFRIGWAQGGIFVIALVKDDQLVSTPIFAPAISAAETQDGVELLLDGSEASEPGPEPNDHHLFIGALTDDVLQKMQGQPTTVSPAQLDVARSTVGACYLVEIKVSSAYLDISPNSRPVGAGVRYGFDIAVNDWDREPSPDRIHQAFWQYPGEDYAYWPASYPLIELAAP